MSVLRPNEPWNGELGIATYDAVAVHHGSEGTGGSSHRWARAYSNLRDGSFGRR
jgi:hypothetical protein